MVSSQREEKMTIVTSRPLKAQYKSGYDIANENAEINKYIQSYLILNKDLLLLEVI